MIHSATAEELGGIRLRVGSTPHVELYAGHIGYNVHEPHRGHRYAARSVRLLVPIAHRFGLNPVWITCDPENIASRRTLEVVGFEFVEVIDVPEDCVIFQSGHQVASAVAKGRPWVAVAFCLREVTMPNRTKLSQPQLRQIGSSCAHSILTTSRQHSGGSGTRS